MPLGPEVYGSMVATLDVADLSHVVDAVKHAISHRDTTNMLYAVFSFF
jgi:hypothetical protein